MSAKSKRVKEDELPEITIELSIMNRLGVHGRPAAAFVKVANRFDCMIFAEKGGDVVNARSIVGLLMLAAGPGSKVVLRARGHDAKAALEALAQLVRNKFHED